MVLTRDKPGTNDGLPAFVLIALGTTWLLAAPLALSWRHGSPPAAYQLALAGLSALGPSFAAFVVARRQGRLGEVFGRFRANPAWVVLALFTPMFLHLLAKLAWLAVGGGVSRWFWLPRTPEQMLALVFFSVGEEFGWRGFAHPALVRRYGPVLGPLVTGVIWGLWHLVYGVAPDGSFDGLSFLLLVIEIVLFAVIVAWLFERSNRSLAVAIAIHAGAHLDNSARLSPEEGGLRAALLLVIALAAALAARALRFNPARSHQDRGASTR